MSFAEYRSGSSHKKSNAPPSALRLVTSESSGLYRGKRITTTSGLLRRPIAIGFPVAFTLSTISRKRLRAFVVVNIFMHLLYKTYKIVQVCVRRLNLRSFDYSIFPFVDDSLQIGIFKENITQQKPYFIVPVPVYSITIYYDFAVDKQWITSPVYFLRFLSHFLSKKAPDTFFLNKEPLSSPSGGDKDSRSIPFVSSDLWSVHAQGR